ncbi:MAG: formylglycine-generating enzyme family protein [Opitutaceae bacterium]|nr:formylglycine-generating enzyme family protein [Opitutaceae bacterium]
MTKNFARFLAAAATLFALGLTDAVAAPAWKDQKTITLRWPRAGGGGEVSFTLVAIQPGTFLMGSPAGEIDRTPGEGPQTKVTLTRPFWLAATEVTQEQWAAVMTGVPDPSHFKGPRLPVDRVAFDEAIEFCARLNARFAAELPPGVKFTLPTEAQWEYACRAGTTGPYAGNIDEMSWYQANSGCTPIRDAAGKITGYNDDGSSKPVATKKPNAWGLYDMHGNVWEWCLDFKFEQLPGGAVSDLRGPPNGTEHARRGGGWKGVATDGRSADRHWSKPDARGRGLGFRIAAVFAP